MTSSRGPSPALGPRASLVNKTGQPEELTVRLPLMALVVGAERKEGMEFQSLSPDAPPGILSRLTEWQNGLQCEGLMH